MKTRIVYLLHFDQPFKHARHYLGSAVKLDDRLEEHRRGTGSRLMAVVAAAGISWRLARTWRGGRQLERQLKNHGGATRMCPICTPTTRRARLRRLQRSRHHTPSTPENA